LWETVALGAFVAHSAGLSCGECLPCPALPKETMLLGCRKRRCKPCMCMHEAVGLRRPGSDCLSNPCFHTRAPRMRVGAHLQACASAAGVAGGASL
jgi:hypothetical protein